MRRKSSPSYFPPRVYVIIPDMPFTTETARAARARSHGLRRAAYWRALGWPNLQKAWKVRAAKRRALQDARAVATALLSGSKTREKL
jgi:hypothetical protein